MNKKALLIGLLIATLCLALASSIQADETTPDPEQPEPESIPEETTTTKRLYTWGVAENILLNVKNKVLHSFDGFDYRYSPKGFFDVWRGDEHQGKLNFGIKGTINEQNLIKTMSDFNWTWQIIENTPEEIKVKANNNFPSFEWEMTLTAKKYEPLKITHTITNNLEKDIENTELFYLIDVNTETNPYIKYEKKDNTIATYNYSQDKLYTTQDTNFQQHYNQIKLGQYKFLFEDLINDGFEVTKIFIGNLNNLNNKLPNTKGFVIGVTKGDKKIPKGTTIIIDPVLGVESSDLDGKITYVGGSYLTTGTTYLAVGHLGIGNYYWDRSVLQFDISGLSSSMADMNLNIYLRVASVSNETCTFDLNSITTLGVSIDQTDWDSTVFEKTIDNWFDETFPIETWALGDILTSYNNAVSGERGYLTFRIGMDNESLYTDTTNDCAFTFCSTGYILGVCDGSTTDPYINYTESPPTDSCTCAVSGTWAITGGDTCTLTDTCDLAGDMHIQSGSLTIATGGLLVVPEANKLIIEDDQNLIIQGGEVVVR